MTSLAKRYQEAPSKQVSASIILIITIDISIIMVMRFLVKKVMIN